MLPMPEKRGKIPANKTTPGTAKLLRLIGCCDGIFLLCLSFWITAGSRATSMSIGKGPCYFLCVSVDRVWQLPCKAFSTVSCTAGQGKASVTRQDNEVCCWIRTNMTLFIVDGSREDPCARCDSSAIKILKGMFIKCVLCSWSRRRIAWRAKQNKTQF